MIYMIAKHLKLAFAIAAGLACASAIADNPGKLTGKGSKDDPYLIQSKRSLITLRDTIAKRKDFTVGKYFRLTSDITLNSRVLDDQGELVADSASLEKWTPIGQDSYGIGFYGNFDGCGHTISGMYINGGKSKNMGLFGYISKEAKVSNLILADSYVCGRESTGGIVGLCKGEVRGCESYARVHAEGPTHQSGGIVGALWDDGLVSQCVNHGYVTGATVYNPYDEVWNCSTGGIVGNVYARVDSCLNKGKVMSFGWGTVGGITGTTQDSYVSNSINEGTVSSDTNAYIGGIVGSNYTFVTGCVNRGNVIATAPGSCIGGISGGNHGDSWVSGSKNYADLICEVDSVFVGGIIGRLNGGRSYGYYSTPKVYSSENHGTIQTTSEKGQCGGIAGLCRCGEIYTTTNYGRVISASKVGGIIPHGEFHTHIDSCSNHGQVEGWLSTGGIAGSLESEASNCINTGRVINLSGQNECGGIVGKLLDNVARFCVNTGIIGNGKYVGGIVGDNTNYSHIISSYNAGLVFSETEGAHIGGLCGGSAELIYSYNAGTVHAKADGISAGGLTYYLWVHWDGHGTRFGSSALNCYNAGDIIIEGSNCVAGNIAASYKSNEASYFFKNCFYLENAIYGQADCSLDKSNKSITAIDRYGFKTLAESLNKPVDYWWDLQPFVQGYCRPLIMRNPSFEELGEPMDCFQVVTMGGDSVLVDRGLPMDNSFLRTDDESVARNAYNTICGEYAGKVRMVDEEPYVLDSNIQVGELSYIRHLSPAYNAVCLPVSVEETMIQAESGMLAPWKISDGVVMIDKVMAADAGEPFLLAGTGLNETLWLQWENASLAPVKASSDGVLKGTFSELDGEIEGAYGLSDDGMRWLRLKEGSRVAPFRAYVEDYGDVYDELDIKMEESRMASLNDGRHDVKVNGRNLHISGIAYSESVKVFNSDGRVVIVKDGCPESIDILLPCRGVYIICVGDDTRKAMVR